VRIGRVEHSDKLRARQTAEILAVRLRAAEGRVQVTGLAPNDGVEPTRVRLTEESGSLMLVGHLPHLGRLVSAGWGSTRTVRWSSSRRGGVVRLDRDAARTWVVRWVLPPDLVAPSGGVAD